MNLMLYSSFSLFVFSVSRWFIRIAFAFAFSADYSLMSAATAQQLQRGGIDRAIRCKCVNSAASAEPPLHKNVNSADCSLTPACHFRGYIAQIAIKKRACSPLQTCSL